MSLVKLRENEQLSFMCPACETWHTVHYGQSMNPRWTWNGDLDKPTLSPSLLVQAIRSNLTDDEWKEYDNLAAQCKDSQVLFDSKFGVRCHSFVKDGSIQFLSDCTHAFANSTLAIPNWEDYSK